MVDNSADWRVRVCKRGSWGQPSPTGRWEISAETGRSCDGARCVRVPWAAQARTIARQDHRRLDPPRDVRGNFDIILDHLIDYHACLSAFPPRTHLRRVCYALLSVHPNWMLILGIRCCGLFGLQVPRHRVSAGHTCTEKRIPVPSVTFLRSAAHACAMAPRAVNQRAKQPVTSECHNRSQITDHRSRIEGFSPRRGKLETASPARHS